MAKKIVAILLTAVLMTQIFVIGVSAKDKEYIITNPYEEVDWDTWQGYKFQPHAHTNASDGYQTIDRFVQMHYDYDYDIVALTDHGTINQGWNKSPELVPIIRLVKYERTQMADIIPLSEEAYQSYLNGTAASETRTHKNGMLDVPKGIELNMATPIADCHLTGYFSDYGQASIGVYGDYETPTAGVKKAGGISMLAHVGEYMYRMESKDHVGQKVDDYYANKFARLFMDNVGSSVGMGINSSRDENTRCDRILYDQILQKTIPNGVVPWCFSFSDSHSDRSVNYAYTMIMMDSFDMDTFRTNFTNGLCFAVSHYSNGVELNGMEEMPGFSEDKVDEGELYTYNNTPMVTNIVVDEEKDTITVEGINFNSITWVSNGNVISRKTDIKNGKVTLDLHNDELLDDPYLYLRFYITGENGICYSQPFVLNVEGEEFEEVEVPKTDDISTLLRGIISILDPLIFRLNPFVWLFKYVALGYSVWQNGTWDRFWNPI